MALLEAFRGRLRAVPVDFFLKEFQDHSCYLNHGDVSKQSPFALEFEVHVLWNKSNLTARIIKLAISSPEIQVRRTSIVHLVFFSIYIFLFWLLCINRATYLIQTFSYLSKTFILSFMRGLLFSMCLGFFGEGGGRWNVYFSLNQCRANLKLYVCWSSTNIKLTKLLFKFRF